ncbi:ATP-binding protein [Pectobacterium aroidearum]|uniref:ATP-binding protein n=1 Tax=Pectobacterium aroidearum TaxID=1201031 RepID=UPI00331620DD
MVFYSESEAPPTGNKLFGLDVEFGRLLAFCSLVWSDDWPSTKKLYSINPTVMLYGSPGTGKTSLLKNVALEVQTQDVKYFSYSLERLLHKDLGRSSEELRELFNFIRSKSGEEEKVLVHFDDVDSVLSSRYIENESSGVKRFVNTFIKELDKIFIDVQTFSPIIAVTTNIYPMIDSAVKRRFSLKLSVENNVSEEEFKAWLAPMIENLGICESIRYEIIHGKMKQRNLTPYDVCLAMQSLLLDKLSGRVVDCCAIEHEFDTIESSKCNEYQNFKYA